MAHYIKDKTPAECWEAIFGNETPLSVSRRGEDVKTVVDALPYSKRDRATLHRKLEKFCYEFYTNKHHETRWAVLHLWRDKTFFGIGLYDSEEEAEDNMGSSSGNAIPVRVSIRAIGSKRNNRNS